MRNTNEESIKEQSLRVANRSYYNIPPATWRIRLTLWGFFSFFLIYGTLLYLFLATTYFRWAYSDETKRAAVGSVSIKGGIAVLGGIATALFMVSLLKQSRNMKATRVIIKAGFYQVFASLCTLEVFYLLLATWISLSDFKNATIDLLRQKLVLTLIGIQTFGMEAVLFCLPFAFLCGTIAGGGILLLRRRLPPSVRSIHKTARASIASLVLGVFGLLFYWLMFLGVVLSIFAVAYGILGSLSLELSSSRLKTISRLGLGLGLAGLLAFILSIVSGL